MVTLCSICDWIIFSSFLSSQVPFPALFSSCAVKYLFFNSLDMHSLKEYKNDHEESAGIPDSMLAS